MQTCQQRFDRWELHITYVCALFSHHPPAAVMSPGCSEGGGVCPSHSACSNFSEIFCWHQIKNLKY